VLTDAALWALTKDARRNAEAADTEAREQPSTEAKARLTKAMADYERLARQWQTRIGGVA